MVPRRWQSASRVLARRWWPLLLFVVLAVAFSPRALAGDRVLSPVDMLEPVAPYDAELDHEPYVHSPLQVDQVESLPNIVEFHDHLRRGDYQMWDPQIGGGVATGTVPLWGLHSPFHVGYLIGPAWYAPALRVFLALVVSMGFTHLFLRELGTSRTAAVLGAVAYTFTGTNLVLLNRIMAVFLLPALLWAVLRVLRRPTVANVVAVGAFTAWTWVEGFPSGFVYSVAMAAGLAVWVAGHRLIERRGGGHGWREAWHRAWPEVRRVVAVGGGVVTGVALSSITLLPFVSEVTRSGTLDTRVYTADDHLPTRTVFGLLERTATGPARIGDFWMDVHPIESTAAVGGLVVLGAAAALLASLAGRLRIPARGVPVWSFFAVLVPLLVVVVYYGTVLTSIAYEVPGIGQGPLSRTRYLIAFGAVTLAALAFDGLVGRATATARPSRWWSAGVLAVAAGVAVTGGPDFVAKAREAGELGSVLTSFAIGLAAAGAFATLVAVAVRVRRLRPAVVVVGAALLFVQLALPMRGVTPAAPIADFLPTTDAHRALSELTGDRYRFAATDNNFTPNSSTHHDLHDVRGHMIRYDELKALITAADPEAFDRDPLKMYMGRDQWNLRSPVWDEMSLRILALGLGELPFGTVQPVRSTWDAWVPVDGSTRSVAAPTGEPAGVALALDAEGACDAADVTVTVTDDAGRSVTAERPVRHVDTGALSWFGLPGHELAVDGPLALEVRAEGGGCDVVLGVVDGPGGTPALEWMVDDPADGVRLVANDGALLYERPHALELITTHGAWRAVPDVAEAVDAVAERTPGPDAGDTAVVVGELPDGAAEGRGAPAEILHRELGDGWVTVTTRGDASSLVAIRQTGAPDWEATVDGQPVEILALNGAQQAVLVPPGEHTVELRYAPRSFTLGVAVTSVTAVAMVAAVLGARWRRRRGGEPSAVSSTAPGVAAEPVDGW